jgi:hypothetical protein
MQANNLTELLTLLTEDSALSEKDAFELLRSLVGDGIRVRAEPSKGDGVPRRVLLTAIRMHADQRELSRQCNGIVLEYPSWKVLAMPSRAFDPHVNVTHICNNIQKYKMYDIKDGTTITLYWHSVTSTWVMSSANGFDVGGYRWMGRATYSEAFNVVAAAYPEFKYELLDKGYSYTIGFRHPDFHPLLSDGPKMWFIQSCDLALMNSADHRLVLSDNMTRPASAEQHGLVIPLQVTTDAGGRKGKELLTWISNRNIGAYQRYLQSLKADPADSNPAIHYGFVLRSTCGEPDYILESDLLQHVRSLIYNQPKKQGIGKVVIGETNRLDYSALRAYLTPAARYRFINLFPQYIDKYRSFEQHFNTLSEKIINILQQQKPYTDRVTRPMNQVDMLAAQFAAHIQSQENINVLGADGPGIIMDFITDRNYLDVYFATFIAPPFSPGHIGCVPALRSDGARPSARGRPVGKQ